MAIVNAAADVFEKKVHKMSIVKMNLVDSVKTKGRWRSKLRMYVAEEMRDVRGMKRLEDVSFRPVSEQAWTQYMGAAGDGVYRENG